MSFKNILITIIVIVLATYLILFWENRSEKTKLHFFGQKIDMNLGVLMLTVFIDTALLTGLGIWLFYS